MRPEQAHAAGGKPVRERGLVEEADAVDVRGDEVMTGEHLASDFEVDGVDVVEQAGGEESADVEHQPEKDDEGEGSGIPGARGGKLRIGGLGEARCAHG